MTPARNGPTVPSPPKRIAQPTVRRLSLYLRLLEEIEEQGAATISSDELARLGGATSAQVRKDLSGFGSFGKRGLGYGVPELIGSLREILGLGRTWRVVIVGAGKVGLALALYAGFRERGFTVIAVYDNDPAKIGATEGGFLVRDISRLEHDAAREHPDIAVLAVPADHAQETVDRVIRAGITGILNFAAARLRVPRGVSVQAVNMAAEMEVLSYALARAKG